MPDNPSASLVHRALKVFELLTLTASLFALSPSLGYAYLDLGTGSYVIQFVLATLFGAMVFFRAHIRRLYTRLKKLVACITSHGRDDK